MIRLPTIRQTVYLFYIVAVVLLGGCGPELSQPSQNSPPTLTAIISPTVVHEPSKISPTPSTESQAATVESIATAPLLRFDSWSPTSDFIAYWTFTAEEASLSHTNPPGSLSFLNARTGQSCLYPYKVPSDTSLIWQSDGKIVVLSGDIARLGAPCDSDFVVVTDPVGILANTFDPSLSPKGDNRAITTAIRNDDGTFSATTSIVDAHTGDMKNKIEWRHRGGLGDLGLGGQWLTEALFLIYETLDQGPLLINAGEGITHIVPDLVGALNLKNDVSVRAIGAGVTGTDTYSVILSGVGANDNFPFVRLYHSKTHEVEELPFQETWTPPFSADGKWLFLFKRIFKNGYESFDDSEIWVRPVEPVGAEAHLLAVGGYSAWSSDRTSLALSTSTGISAVSFPESAQIGSWEIKDYDAVPVAWSPDNKLLAVYGYIPGQHQEALFVIHVR